MSQSLAEGSHCQNLYTTSRSGAPESSSEVQQSRQEHGHLDVSTHNLEAENATHVKARFALFEAQVSQIPQSRGMLEVGRKWATLQAEVILLGSQDLHTSLNIWIGQWKRSPQLRVRCNEFWHLPEPTQYAAR